MWAGNGLCWAAQIWGVAERRGLSPVLWLQRLALHNARGQGPFSVSACGWRLEGVCGLGGEACALQPLGQPCFALESRAWSGPGRWTAAPAPLLAAPQLSVWDPRAQRPPQLSHAVTRARGAPEGEMGLAPQEKIEVVAGSGLPQNCLQLGCLFPLTLSSTHKLAAAVTSPIQ